MAKPKSQKAKKSLARSKAATFLDEIEPRLKTLRNELRDLGCFLYISTTRDGFFDIFVIPYTTVINPTNRG